MAVGIPYRANWVCVSGTKYSLPCALVIGTDSEAELKFGKAVAIYVEGQSVLFEFIPMVTHNISHHHHAYALKTPPLPSRHKYLIKHSHLIDHPYGLYHSTSLSADTTTEYIVLRSNIYLS